jgi:hypothetical protein
MGKEAIYVSSHVGYVVKDEVESGVESLNQLERPIIAARGAEIKVSYSGNSPYNIRLPNFVAGDQSSVVFS